MFIQVNEGCDSRCQLCDYWRLKNPAVLTLEDLNSVVLPAIEPFRPLTNVSITGGEPTLHPELGQLARCLARYADTLTLVTSTTRLADHFADLGPVVSSYLISVDGVDPKTYKRARGIDLADSALAWLPQIRRQAPQARVAVSCVIQKANHAELVDIVDGCLARGAHHVFLRCPSLSPTAFAHGDNSMARITRAASLTQPEIELVGAQLDVLSERYSADQLPNVGEYRSLLDTLAGRKAGTGTACDVPFTSFVITAGGQFMPCFYLPHAARCADRREIDVVRSEVQQRVLYDESFRSTYCDGCHQFTGRRMPVDVAVRTHRQQVRTLRVAERLDRIGSTA